MMEENATDRKRLRAIVRGRVQGVGFRYFVMERARSLYIVGFCRNLPNGEVEVVAEGQKGELQALESSLKTGPTMANVEEVISAWQAPVGEFTNFRISGVDEY